MLEVRPAIYALASTLALTDTLDLLVRLLFRRIQSHGDETSVPIDVGRFTPYQMKLHLRPFAIVASVHNLSRRAEEFVARLGRFRDRLWVIDDASTDDTVEQLERLGVRCVHGSPNRKKPGAIRQLLGVLPPEVTTIVVDKDPEAGLDIHAAQIPESLTPVEAG